MINNLKGAIFDMDGTLIDSLMLWDIIWKSLGEKFIEGGEFKPAEEHDRAVRTMTLKGAMDYIYDIYRISSSGKELLDEVNEIMRKFYAEQVELKKGVREFLEYCYKNGVKMCIASATDVKLLNVAIEHCDIGKYFKGILSCADIGKGKDQPDIYLKALDFLGTSKDETWVFEDALVAIRTADCMGIKTVGIYDKYNYGQDEIKKTATIYIDKGETIEKLI